MCFSSTASFTSSAILAIAGVALIYKVKRSKQLLLAVIPLVFALQQFSEGVLWLYMPNEIGKEIAILAKDTFLFFAYSFWPIWIPFAFLILESDRRTKIVMAILLGLGIFIGISLLIKIPITEAKSYLFSINYQEPINYIKSNIIDHLIYLLIITLPMFLSSLKNLKLFAVVILITAFGTYLINEVLYTSVWCFFSALSSLLLFFIVKRPSRENLQPPRAL